MSAKDKNRLGYGTQLDEMSNKSEIDSEVSMSVFEVRSSDEEITPANDGRSKADGYHPVPPPITGNFLTLRADISFAGLDELAIRKKIIESKTTGINTETNETVGKTNAVNVKKPKTNETQTVRTKADKIGHVSQKSGIGFKKVKSYLVYKSTDHLIKDYNFYDKNSPEPKLRNVVNTGQRVVKPVWDNAKRVNHQKISTKLKYPQARRTFVPSGVLTRIGVVSIVRPKVNPDRLNVSTVRPKVNPVRPNISTARSVSAFRPISPRMDNVRPRASYSPIKRSYYTKPALRPKDLKKVVKTFGIKNRITVGTRAVVSTSKGKIDNVLKKSKWVWRPKGNYMDHESKESGSFILKKFEYADPKGISKSVLTWATKLIFQTMKTTMEAVWLLEVIQNEKNSVLFTDTKCLILSPSFKLLDENQVILRAARQNDVYSLDLKNIVPSGGITYLYANATSDESKLWHRRLGHVNFKNINKLVKGHLVRGLPSKVFVNDHTCVACKKGKQHKASCKAKLERTIKKPLELLHMDLFGPVSVASINKKKYCLVVTDDFSRFSWVFFLATNDETN
ncbi:putative ribonuclease H-like domain-containing protein [Tanacetum coccineum]|uniref:Ribonuclease H-like domain-containing protein n=1 Tax=Tanacetum coccineum TaxID=301880 RepID=A0ABQ5BDJ5_9ASTR